MAPKRTVLLDDLMGDRPSRDLDHSANSLRFSMVRVVKIVFFTIFCFFDVCFDLCFCTPGVFCTRHHLRDQGVNDFSMDDDDDDDGPLSKSMFDLRGSQPAGEHVRAGSHSRGSPSKNSLPSKTPRRASFAHLPGSTPPRKGRLYIRCTGHPSVLSPITCPLH
jgi:hypothetical protein